MVQHILCMVCRVPVRWSKKTPTWYKIKQSIEALHSISWTNNLVTGDPAQKLTVGTYVEGTSASNPSPFMAVGYGRI